MDKNTHDPELLAAEIADCATDLLIRAVSDEYARSLWEQIGSAVTDDVVVCSGISNGEGFSETDVKYALGRVLLDRLTS